MLHHILGLAAQPLTTWVPLLQPEWRRAHPAPRPTTDFALKLGAAVAEVVAEMVAEAVAGAVAKAVAWAVTLLLSLRPWHRSV